MKPLTTSTRRHMGRQPSQLTMAIGLMALLATAASAATPVFGGVPTIPLLCSEEGESAGDESPSSLDLVGNDVFPPAEVGHDDHFLYLRYRVDGDPTGPDGFAQAAWVSLIQVPGGDPFQYQYMVSLNGNGSPDDFGNTGDSVELWANTEATDIEFDPLFHDQAEVRLFAQQYDFVSAATVNDAPLAATSVTGDGSSFGGDPDYFVDFAIPLSVLFDNGVIASVADLDEFLFFPAGSTNSSNYNKDIIDGCTFLPATRLVVDKTVSQPFVLANTPTAVQYDIAVTNTGGIDARGITIEDADATAFLSALDVTASVSDPGISVSVDSMDPVVVRVDGLPMGETATVHLTGTVTASCDDASFMNMASAAAINAREATATATLPVDRTSGTELCDGIDNDCDGSIDEGGDGLCDDGNACTIDSCSAGVCATTPIASCTPCATDPDCNDANACTTDSCSAGVCATTPIAGCTPCATDPDCNDANACTTDSCSAGSCSILPIDFCIPCDTDTDCADGNACTTDACVAGVCNPQPIEGCIPCASGTDCADDSPCTDDVCTANGTCDFVSVAGCTPCDTHDDCSDGSGCTSDQCGPDGSCVISTIPGCIPCDTDGDCTDESQCTDDHCMAGACVSVGIPDCHECTPSAEVCGDGLDNDCNDRTDCEDRSCSGAPSCSGPVEICGDCIDNDDDGFIDLADPDCGCMEPTILDLRQLRIKTKKKVRKKRLKVRGIWADSLPIGLDPRDTGLTLQLTDANGAIFCTHFAADAWKRKGKARTTFRHRDKTTVRSKGMRLARFKVNRKGRVIFTARGPRTEFRSTPISGDVKVAVQVGEHCSVSTATLRPKGRRLVFP